MNGRKDARAAMTERMVKAALTGTTSKQLAERFGVPSSTIARRLRDAGLVPADVLGVWRKP